MVSLNFRKIRAIIIIKLKQDTFKKNRNSMKIRAIPTHGCITFIGKRKNTVGSYGISINSKFYKSVYKNDFVKVSCCSVGKIKKN